VLGLGIGAALWAGMGVFLASENAMNHLWGVPFKRRPNFIRSRGRALVLLFLLGGGMLVTTVLAGVAGFGASFGITWKIGSIALSSALNFGLFWVGFRVLTARDVSWRQLRGGAIGAAVFYAIGAVLQGEIDLGDVQARARRFLTDTPVPDDLQLIERVLRGPAGRPPTVAGGSPLARAQHRPQPPPPDPS